MGARHDADLHIDGTDRLLVTAVDAGLAGDDALAYSLLLQLGKRAPDIFRRPFRVVAFACQRLDSGGPDVTNSRLALHLVADLVRRGETGGCLRLHGAGQLLVFFRRLPVPGRLASLGGQFLDGVDRRLHLLVPVHDGAQHDIFRKALRFRFDHQHGILRAGNDQLQVRLFQRCDTGVQHVVAIDVADFSRADRAGKWHARNRERGGGANQ